MSTTAVPETIIPRKLLARITSLKRIQSLIHAGWSNVYSYDRIQEYSCVRGNGGHDWIQQERNLPVSVSEEVEVSGAVCNGGEEKKESVIEALCLKCAQMRNLEGEEERLERFCDAEERGLVFTELMV